MENCFAFATVYVGCPRKWISGIPWKIDLKKLLLTCAEFRERIPRIPRSTADFRGKNYTESSYEHENGHRQEKNIYTDTDTDTDMDKDTDTSMDMNMDIAMDMDMGMDIYIGIDTDTGMDMDTDENKDTYMGMDTTHEHGHMDTLTWT
jgi:hypothetical protein